MNMVHARGLAGGTIRIKSGRFKQVDLTKVPWRLSSAGRIVRYEEELVGTGSNHGCKRGWAKC
jgi:hypothetical protein